MWTGALYVSAEGAQSDRISVASAGCGARLAAAAHSMYGSVVSSKMYVCARMYML